MKNLLTLFLLATLFTSCEDFLSGPLLDQNPNEVDDVSIVSPEALLVGSQVTMYGVMEGYLNRAVSMVMQQMSGLQTDYYRDYNCEPIDVNTNGRWTAIYGTGGLVDMRTTQKVADDQEKFILLAISQMWEALIISTAADLWGDIPYSEAANSNYGSPNLDSQREVHEAVLELINDAINNFSLGQVQTFSSNYDFSFGGNANKWIAVAHTLAARIYLNWAEVDGIQAYENALFHAEQGVSSSNGTGDWRALHSTTNNEQSIWWQFTIKNNDYMGAGHLLVDMLENHNDGRLNIYFSGDPVVGVKPGETQFYGSDLNSNTYGSRDYGVEFIFSNNDLGGDRYLKSGELVTDQDIEQLKNADAVLLGAIGHPGVKPGILEQGILLKLRKEFDQYINLRPVILYPGVETPLANKNPEDINFV